MKQLYLFFFLSLSVILMMSMLHAPDSFSATINAKNSGGIWSNPSTWNGGIVPTVADIAVIDSSAVVTINATVSVGSIKVNCQSGSGTTTLIVVDNVTFTITGSATVAAGFTFTQIAKFVIGDGSAGPGGKAIVNVGGDFTLSASANSLGVVDMSRGPGELYIKGNFSLPNKGTLLSSSSSLVNFNGTGSQLIPIGDGSAGKSSIGYKHLIVSNSSNSVAFSPAGTSVVNSTSLAGNLTLGTNSTFFNGGLSMSGTGILDIQNGAKFYISGTAGFPSGFTHQIAINTTIHFNGTNQNIDNPNNSQSYYNVIFEGSGNKTLTGSVTVSGNLTISNPAVLVGGSFTINVAGTWSNYTTATFQEGTSTVNFNGTTSQNITCLSTEDFYNVTFSNTGTKTLLIPINAANNLTISGTAVLNPVNRTVTVGGAWSDYGTAGFTEGTGTVTFNGAGAQSITCPGGENFYVVNFSNTGNTTLNNNITVASALNINSPAILIGGNNTINISGTWTNYGTAGFTEATSTVNFNNAGAQTTASTVSEDFYNVIFSNSGTKTLNVPINVKNNLTISGSAVLNPVNRTITVGGAWFDYGTVGFTEGTGTVTFNGAGAQSITCPGGENFYLVNFTNNGNTTLNNNIIVASALNINSPAILSGGSATVTLNGTFACYGSAGFVPGTSTVIYNESVATGVLALNYFNLNSTNVGSRTLANAGTIGVAGTFTPGANVYIITGSTIDYNGSGAQNIANFTYNNLTLSNTGNKTPVLPLVVNNNLTINGAAVLIGTGGTINVGGAWSDYGTAGFTEGTGTVTFNGTGAQSITCPGGEDFYTINFTNSGNTTLNNNITVASALNINSPAILSGGSATITLNGTIACYGSAGFIPGTSTVKYNESVATNILALNYFNLTSANIGARTLANAGTIGVAGSFTPGANAYTITGSTVDYDGNGAQNIANFTYNNLTVSNTGSKTPVLPLVVNNNITINGTAVLNGTGGTINVGGNWTSYGQAGFTEGTGTVNFDGSTLQTINTTGGEIFNKQIINNAAGVTLASACTVAGKLNLTNGTYTSNGNLTMDLNTGFIDYVAGDNGSIAGNMIVKKQLNYISGGPSTQSQNHFVISPLAGSLATDDFQDDFQIINPSTGHSRLLRWDSSTQKWIEILNTGHAVNQTTGYQLWVTASNKLDFPGTYNHSATYTTPVYASPAANKYILVGNPFPSALDWESASWGLTNVNPTLYLYDPQDPINPAAPGGYRVYTKGGTSVNGGTRYIPAMQAFFVNTVGAGNASVTMPNGVRTNTVNPALYRNGAEETTLRLTAISGAYKDETLIRFAHGSTDSFEGDLDAYKMMNPDGMPSLYSNINGDDYCINSVAASDYKRIDVNITSDFSGIYTIVARQANSFPDHDVILEDKALGKKQDLKSNPNYSAFINSDDKPGRFAVVFRKAVYPNTNTQVSVSIGSDGKVVNAQFANMNSLVADLKVFNTLGNEVYSKENIDISSGSYLFSPGLLTAGIYIVKFVVNGNIYTGKVFLNQN